MSKTCKKCDRAKPLEMFWKQAKGKQGRRPNCIECESNLSEDRHRKYLLDKAKNRAKKKNLPFSLTYKDFELPTHCPLLGKQLRRNVGGRNQWDFSPTLDRIDPELGYVPGNVWVVSSLANQIMSDATPETVLRVACIYYKVRHGKEPTLTIED